MNILIIEDDVFLSWKIKNVFQAQVLTNRISLIHSLKDFYHILGIIETFDIVLTDIQLSDVYGNKDGFEIIKIIRKKDIKIPIVVISGSGNIDDLQYAFHIWASDYIIKPVRLQELEVRILNWYTNFYLSHISFVWKICFYKELSYHLDVNEFYFQNIPIKLTKGNKYLLSLFFAHREKLLTEHFLIEKIRGDLYMIIERNLRINILRLKKWLSQFWIDNRIENIRWEGYIFIAK